MNIRAKLITGYVVVSLLIGIIGLVGIRVINDIENQFDEVTNEILPVITALEELQLKAIQIVAWANEFSLTISEIQNAKGAEGEELREKLDEEIEEEWSESGIPPYHKALANFEILAKQNAPEYDKFLGQIKIFGENLIKAGEELVQAKLKGASGKEVLKIIEELENQGKPFFGLIAKTLSHENEEANELHENLEKTILWATEILLITGVVVFLIAVILGLIISQTISSPIIDLTKAVSEVGKKKFDTRVEITTKDEIGVLAKSFNKMAEDLGRTTVSKKYFEGIVNSINSSLIILTSDGIIKEVNDATCYQLGYLAEELIGQSIETLIDKESYFQEDSADPLSFLGFINNVEISYLTKSGEKIPVMYSGSTVSDDEGEIGGYVCVAQNLAELKQLEAKLKKKT